MELHETYGHGIADVSLPEAREGREPPDSLRVHPWSDPVIDRLGHDPRSAYVERFWLSILGPSTTWLLRRLANDLDQHPEGLDIDLGTTARSLGLGTKSGPNAPFGRAVRRACDFGLARYEGRETLAVRRRVPPLTRGQVNRLPIALKDEHRSWQERSSVGSGAAEVRQRARRLALSLVELGEDREATERQLHRWRFHPAIAFESTAWAWAHHHSREAAAVDPSARPAEVAQQVEQEPDPEARGPLLEDPL